MSNFYPPGLEPKVKTIAIDFDGVIHNANLGWGDGTCYGDPIPGSIEAVKKLASNYRIVVFTAKAKADRPLVNGKTGVELVTDWLKKYGLVNFVSEITSEKPRAELYIDDNGYRFENWNDALNFVEKSV